MATTKAQQKATAKYMKQNLDDVKFRVPKGKRDLIKAYAESKGQSLQGYINALIDRDMAGDGENQS